MKAILIVSTIGLVFLAPVCLFAQDTLIRLDLQQAVELGLANSKQLKVSVEKVITAAAKVNESSSQQVPQLNVSSSYTRVSDNVTPLTVKFPGAASPLVLNPLILDQFSENLAVSQLVYSGGRIRKTVTSLDFLRKAAGLDYENDRSSAVLNIVTAYYTLYSLQQSEKILAANESLLKARIKDLENLETNGIVLHNDVLKLLLSLSQLNIQQLDTRNAFESTRYSLVVLLGLPDSARLQLDTSQFFSHKLDKPYAAYENMALTSRPDLLAAADRQQAAKFSIAATRAGYSPTLSASAAYNYLKPNPRWLPERNRFDGTWYAGVTLAWNVSSLLTNRHYMAEAASTFRQNLQLRLSLADNIKTELYSNYLAYGRAVDHLRLSRGTLAQAEENYRIVADQLASNVVLPADLQDAISYLVQSQLNVLIDEAAIDLAYFKFIKSTGTLTNLFSHGS